ncbi:hypothetical protein [Neisseria leonii]|uniref:hypothetical protein n=1 Tax=Neisseria leonii TaxID=2995413 RepID=UPI00237BBAE7|nr:hypothetical protein [Neisseria sp. 3986]MDD9325672.1 hypothetical protein [Neisseria sp. 3986]
MPQHIGNALIGFGGAQLIGRVFGEKWGIFNRRGIPLLPVDNMSNQSEIVIYGVASRTVLTVDNQ